MKISALKNSALLFGILSVLLVFPSCDPFGVKSTGDLITDVEVSGSGDVQVNVAEKLNAEISGSGSIVYKGSPDVHARVSGSGTVKKF